MARPFISVIVPVLNAEATLERCLNALTTQSYPEGAYEIIVVDNGSSDRSMPIASSYDLVRLFHFTDEASSYGARNLGVQEARGDVVAFCDADCLPVPEWLAEGVAVIEASNEVVAGDVHFDFSERPTGAELYDAITNMQIEEGVRERGVAKTANLFVQRHVFDQVGPFPVLRSGGDVIWTKRVTEAGLNLAYAPAAVVNHPTRRLAAMLAKQARVGRGQVHIARASGDSRTRRALRTTRYIVPPRLAPIRDRLVAKGYVADDGDIFPLARVWAAGWVCRLATAAGRMLGSLKSTRARNS